MMSESLAGNLLVASTITADPIVNRSVCLLVHDDAETAIGVMLNRPMQPSPEQLLAMFADGSTGRSNRIASELPASNRESSDAPAEAHAGMLHFGGPLSGPIVAIHTSSEHAEVETGSGIYVAAQKQHLEHLLRHHSSPFRLIVGHLGWTGEQLRGEIAGGYWHLLPATADLVFSAEGDLWPRLIRRATSATVAGWLGTPDVAEACELN